MTLKTDLLIVVSGRSQALGILFNHGVGVN